MRRNVKFAALAAVAFAAAGCRQDMHDQPKYIAMRPSEFFTDGRSERPVVDDTIARGQLRDDTAFYTGKGPDGKPVDTFPFPVTAEVIERGQQRFTIYCTPCHSRLGDGNGMVPRRGFRHPPTYHQDRLRKVPNGYIFDVITNGFGATAGPSSPTYARFSSASTLRSTMFRRKNARVWKRPPEARNDGAGCGF